MRYVECSRAPGGTEVLPIGWGGAFTAGVSQRPDDVAGWTVDLYALFNERGSMFVQRVTLQAPSARRPARVIATGCLPGAYAWKAIVRPPPGFLAVGSLGVNVACREWSATTGGVTVLEGP